MCCRLVNGNIYLTFTEGKDALEALEFDNYAVSIFLHYYMHITFYYALIHIRGKYTLDAEKYSLNTVLNLLV